MGHITIGEDMRSVSIPRTEKVLGCVGDRNVRRVRFSCPRFCDGTDMAGWRVQVHYLNAAGTGDYYEVTDAVAGEGAIEFSWLVGALACAKEGTVTCNVKLSLTDGAQRTNEFNSGNFGLSVLGALSEDPSGHSLVDAENDTVVVNEQEDE